MTDVSEPTLQELGARLLQAWNEQRPPREIDDALFALLSRLDAQPRTIDGKFSTDGVNIFNTVSGEALPEDEPLFLLRARDKFALKAIDAYQFAAEEECNDLHRKGIKQLRSKFKAF